MTGTTEPRLTSASHRTPGPATGPVTGPAAGPASPAGPGAVTRGTGSRVAPLPAGPVHPEPSAGPSAAAPSADPDTVIAATRERIDELDRAIIALIDERVRASAEVQRTRIAAGGRRVQLSREMEILARYREALGRPGTSVAMSLLELCRGRV